MLAYVDTFNSVIGLGTIILEILAVVLLCNLIFARSASNQILVFFQKWGILLGFSIAFGSMALSLFYSDVIGYTACELCWVERSFIYPQVILFGMLVWGRLRDWVLRGVIILSTLGTLVSLYHVYIEHGGSSALACVTGVSAVSCAVRYVYVFGYISIPVMALSAQVLMLLLAINYKYMSRS